MDSTFDYKGTSQIWLGLGIVSAIAGSLLSWLIILFGSGLCFAFAILCQSIHVEQQQAKESLEIRKRLKAIEDRLDSESSLTSGE